MSRNSIQIFLYIILARSVKQILELILLVRVTHLKKFDFTSLSTSNMVFVFITHYLVYQLKIKDFFFTYKLNPFFFSLIIKMIFILILFNYKIFCIQDHIKFFI